MKSFEVDRQEKIEELKKFFTRLTLDEKVDLFKIVKNKDERKIYNPEVYPLFEELFDSFSDMDTSASKKATISKVVKEVFKNKTTGLIGKLYNHFPWLVLEFVDESDIDYSQIDFSGNMSWYFSKYLIEKRPDLFNSEFFDWETNSDLVLGTPFFDAKKFNWRNFTHTFLNKGGKVEDALPYLDETTKVSLYRTEHLPLSELNPSKINWDLVGYVFLKNDESFNFAKDYFVVNRYFVSHLISTCNKFLPYFSPQLNEDNLSHHLLITYAHAARKQCVPIEEIRRVLSIYVGEEIASKVSFEDLKKI